jgi:hypothetical protein
MVKIVVGPDETVVIGGLHPSSNGIRFPGTPDRITSTDQPNVLGKPLSVRNRVVLGIVDDEELVF